MSTRRSHQDPVAAEPAGPGTNAPLVPRWVRGNTNLFATLVTAVVVGVGLFLVAWLAPVIGPMGLGLFMAALAAPVFTRLEERGRSAGLALTVTIVILLAIALGLVLLAVSGASSLVDGIATYSEQIQTRYPDASATLATGGVMALLRDILPPETLANVLRVVGGILISVGQSVLFAAIVAALLLLDGRRLSRLASGGLGSENPVFRETPGIARAAVTYFVVRIRVNAVTAVGLLALLLLLGVDDAILWAVCAFFLSFVPYLGLVLAMIPPAILALAESGPVAAAVVVVGATALNLIAENVLEPTLTGRALHLSTWLVFLMFFFWVWLIGPVGALLSMPITVLVVLVLQHNERTQWVAALLANEAVEGAAAPVAPLPSAPRLDRPEAPHE
jgi:AI-2 transport protein TqsA